jgi:protoporphyrinogen oxidase
MDKGRVIVVGAGPAGLTAAWELVHAGYEVTVLERDPNFVGGLARTISHKGFRFDIGAHRFFSKNPDITRWWRERLPNDFVPIKRHTRILYQGRFFQYPLRPGDAVFGLGIKSSVACALSYLRRQACPVRPERSFEDWVINRFGDELYRIFFKTYTEKVWGMPCHEISADWASQRIKGLSVRQLMLDAVGLRRGTVKTLIDEFEYPRLGAGMMWEKTREEIVQHGGKVIMDRRVVELVREGHRVTAIRAVDSRGEVEEWEADAFIVSMPLQECVSNISPPLDKSVREAAARLSYRDFILVALVVARDNLFPDNWIYIHDPNVKVGRIENYNNWTKEMSPKPGVTCLELEYFCDRNDSLWWKSDADLVALAKHELEQLGLAKASEVLDGCVVRVEKAYPVYDSNYRQNVNIIRKALEPIANLQMVGRNGMHKYNNQDHSMMTGILAARRLSGDCSRNV